MTADLTAATNGGSAAIKAASTDLDLLLETRNRDAEQATPAEIQQFKQEAWTEAPRAWAKVTDERASRIYVSWLWPWVYERR